MLRLLKPELRKLRAESNVYSDKFATRPFAIWGHQITAMLIVYGALLALVVVLAGIGALAKSVKSWTTRN